MKCTEHPDVTATVKTGTTYMCSDCLRVLRPILFVSLPSQPPVPVIR